VWNFSLTSGSQWLFSRTPDDISLLIFVLGEFLNEKYAGATEVRASRKGRLQLRDTRYQLPTANDLVYIGDSPNYCVRDVTIGSLGKSESSH